jgi:hypothetical protein
MLLGQKYLKTGQNIDCFLKSKLIDRIVRFLRTLPNIKNSPKKIIKKRPIKKMKT